MWLALLQRWTAALFLGALLIQSHVLGVRSPRWQWKLVAGTLVVSGFLHAALGLRSILTDRAFFAKHRTATTVVLTLLLTAIVGVSLDAVVRSRAQPMVSGHVRGARCGSCHGPTHRQWPMHEHARLFGPGQCERCHDVQRREPGALAAGVHTDGSELRLSGRNAFCANCHRTESLISTRENVHRDVRCVECHRGSRGVVLIARDSCAQCHPLANDPHRDVEAMDTTFRNANSARDGHSMTCTTCHRERFFGR